MAYSPMAKAAHEAQLRGGGGGGREEDSGGAGPAVDDAYHLASLELRLRAPPLPHGRQWLRSLQWRVLRRCMRYPYLSHQTAHLALLVVGQRHLVIAPGGGGVLHRRP